MLEKIKLTKDRPIVFMGSMNVMPMMYAIELRKLGYEVLYFVDASRRNTLCRPEYHFPEIQYPYPRWIIEFVLPSQLLLPLFPGIFSFLLQRRVKRATNRGVSCFILNGFFCSLAPYLANKPRKVGLSHGSDLDVWANTEHVELLVSGFRRMSIFRYLPEVLSSALIRHIVSKQYAGLASVDAVVYFPNGFSVGGDKVVRKLASVGVRHVPRYDASFEQFRGRPREFRKPSDRLEIFSTVRFHFRTFPEGDIGSNKGNDVIIQGIAKYLSLNRNIRVHFVEKGEDVEYAKDLCRKLGLERVTVWHKEMPFEKLISLYLDTDICIDQLGDHWIGAGMYALWVGRPLIANPASAVRSGIWPRDNPICAAKTPEEVCQWLSRLEDHDLRKALSENSQRFAERYMTPMTALNGIFDLASIEPGPA